MSHSETKDWECDLGSWYHRFDTSGIVENSGLIPRFHSPAISNSVKNHKRLSQVCIHTSGDN